MKTLRPIRWGVALLGALLMVSHRRVRRRPGLSGANRGSLTSYRLTPAWTACLMVAACSPRAWPPATTA